MRELRKKAYNNSQWRKVRDTYLTAHPICEECLKTGKVTPAEDIHHVKSPFQNGEINYNLLLDDNNLMALCKSCHGNIHSRREKTAEELIKILDDLLLNDNWEDDDTTDNN